MNAPHSDAVDSLPNGIHDESSSAETTAKQWLGLGLVAVLVATACVFLGMWQWNRHVSRSAKIAIVEQNYVAPVIPLDELLGPGEVLSRAKEWRRVVVSGRYETTATTFLRNRPVNGRPGFHVLVPLLVTDVGAGHSESTLLLVDRGFISGLDAPAISAVPAPPLGEVTVTVRLRPMEAASTRSAAPGQVHSINATQAMASAGAAASNIPADTVILGAYGGLVSEDPASSPALEPLAEPSTDPGSHLSYAFQWWVFAVGVLSVYVVLLRRERARGKPTLDDLLLSGPGAAPKPRRVNQALVDQDTEDSAIDLQLRS